jgi:tRNA A-37 threonylcarbamoyl transferase component Bud32/CheY-like chemotaxis protein
MSVMAQQMLKLGLVTETQLQEGYEAVGQRTGDLEPLLRALERFGYLTPFQSQKLVKGETGGLVLGGYRVLYKIASGSFGRVYRAEDPGTGRVVAIKVLRQRYSEDAHTIELFEREGRVGLSLKHPNIVEVLAVSQDLFSRHYFIVMEFVEGGNLRDLLGIRGKLEPAEALRFMEEAVAGLAHAYSRGVTHRDIKLTNILISTQKVVKLVDFGLADIFIRKGLEVDRSEKVDRTVDYAGLEKRTGVKSGDVRSDIYFLGCVLYEMLTGRSPLLMTRDPRVRMSGQRFDSVQAMRREEVKAPPTVFQLVERMMTLDPRQRYQTPSQLLDAVRETRADAEGTAPTPVSGQAPKAAKPAMRSVFVVERNEKFQTAMRERFKESGFRVFVAADPARALDRFLINPFDALVINAVTTGEEGRYTFERIMKEAERSELRCAGVLILSEEQADWAEAIPLGPATAVMTLPLSLKQVHRKLLDLMPAEQPTG